MDDRRQQFRVGVVVIATMMIGGLLAALNSSAPLAWVPWGRGKYEVHIDLDQAPGIALNTPVRKNGILIGRVSAVEDLDDRVRVTVSIDDGVRLFPQYAVQVRTSMLGDSTIDFTSRRLPPTAVPLEDGATVTGTVLSNPLEMLADLQGDLSVTINSLGRAGDEVAEVAQRVNRAFGDDLGEQGRVAALIDRANVALDEFSQAMQSAEELFGDQELREQVMSSMRELSVAATDVRRTMQAAEETFKGVDVAVAAADRNLKHLEGFTEPLGREGEKIVDSLTSSIDNIDRALEEFSMFTRAITNSRGTIGQLLNEREFYDNVNQLSLNINQLTVNANHVLRRINDLAKEARPVLYNAGVFTDKIAREPGRLIGGALNRGPAVK